jgi:SAM-dependent methyltransferase
MKKTLSEQKLYGELASWFHLLTRPEDYIEEAEFATKLLPAACTLLELGAGGGNNAFHMKAHFQMTLTDLSDAMLDNSRRINPECEHIAGDMRTLRLNRQFDAVFIHDAVCYMTTEADLRAAIRTAAEHCKPGGVVLIMPDCVKETFRTAVNHSGHDSSDDSGRSLRSQEWTFDPDPADSTYTVDFVYMLREGSGPVRVVHDHHVEGVFPRAVWLELLSEAGLHDAEVLADPWGREVFVARR